MSCSKNALPANKILNGDVKVTKAEHDSMIKSFDSMSIVMIVAHHESA